MKNDEKEIIESLVNIMINQTDIRGIELWAYRKNFYDAAHTIYNEFIKNNSL